MTSKAFLVLLMFLASVLLISAEVAPKDVDEKLNKKDDNLETNGVEKGSKYYGGGGFGGPWGGGYGGGYGGPWGGGYGGGWRGGYGGGWRGGYGGGGYCRFGCCGWGYGGCRRCCYYPGEHLEAHTDAEPHT